MEARATVKYVGIPPRKARLVIDIIRGKSLDEALNILALTPNSAAKVVEKLVKSAAANAENNYDMDIEGLYISEIYANQGESLKRYRAGAQGRAKPYKKRSSHISVVLKEKE